MKGLCCGIVWSLLVAGVAEAALARDAEAEARRDAVRESYGTYSASLRTPEGRVDVARLLDELKELNANTYNWLLWYDDHGWDDLQKFLPMAHDAGIRVWVTLVPPSESPPRTKSYSEPFRLDYEKWGAELGALSAREPALVAWSVDDFAHNLETFTPAVLERVLAAQRAANPRLAFVPCVYYRQATPEFAERYGGFVDGILFPYRSESTKAGLVDASRVEAEIKALQARFGKGFPIIVDIYATAHSTLGSSTPQYVGEVMRRAYPVADGVHIYTHQRRDVAGQREKHDVIRQAMTGWRKEMTDRRDE